MTNGIDIASMESPLAPYQQLRSQLETLLELGADRQVSLPSFAAYHTFAFLFTRLRAIGNTGTEIGVEREYKNEHHTSKVTIRFMPTRIGHRVVSSRVYTIDLDVKVSGAVMHQEDLRFLQLTPPATHPALHASVHFTASMDNEKYFETEVSGRVSEVAKTLLERLT